MAAGLVAGEETVAGSGARVQEGWQDSRRRRRRKRPEVEERVESAQRAAERSGTRVGEGSNVIQIAGNLSQKQLGRALARARARARHRRLINNQPLHRYRGSNVLKQSARRGAARGAHRLSAKTSRRAFCGGKNFRVGTLHRGWFGMARDYLIVYQLGR